MRRPCLTPRGPQRTTRAGFALLAVLWAMVGIAALGMAASLSARRAVATTHNRIALVKAGWQAEGCLERARAAIAEALRDERAHPMGPLPPWRALADVVDRSSVVASRACELSVRPAGAGVDLNTADKEALDRLLAYLRIPKSQADSLRDAMLDWRDADDIARASGAEGDWYAAEGRHLPRNGPFADVRELARVRGSEVIAGRDSLWTAEPGRIPVDLAPLAVLATLPGMTEEALGRLAEQRMRGEPFHDVLRLTATLSPAARDSILTRYPELVGRVTADPDAWILTSTGRVRGVQSVLEVRLVRAGSRAAIVRRRTWN